MTPEFLTPLVFEDDGGYPYKLTAPLIYASGVLHSRITVPAGFKTDLFSIPRALQFLLPKSEKGDQASVVHDFLYQTAPGGCTREQADQTLREGLQVLGVGTIRRNLIYAGVRVGGDGIWAHYRSVQLSSRKAA